MSTSVKTVRPDQTLSEVVSLMSHGGLKRLPVVDGKSLVGIVTRKDLIKAYSNLS